MPFYNKVKLKSLSKITTISLLSIGISACSVTSENTTPKEMMVDLILEDEIYSFHTHQKVNDYTDRLAHDLFRNLHNKKLDKPIAVTSFVNFDDTLQKNSALGNLVSESLISNMQAYDIPIMDIHLMGGVDISSTGDAVFSRNDNDILNIENAAYVLSGVIVESERGYTINARIMELASKKVISSASTFIPSFVIEVI